MFFATRHGAICGLVIGALAWAGNALVARAFHDAIPPLTLAFWRWVLATGLLLPFVARSIWTHRAALRAAGWRLPIVYQGITIDGIVQHDQRGVVPGCSLQCAIEIFYLNVTDKIIVSVQLYRGNTI